MTMEAEKPAPEAPVEGSEELFLSKHPEWDALQWLEKFLPGGSQSACAKAEMQRKGFTTTSLHYAVRPLAAATTAACSPKRAALN